MDRIIFTSYDRIFRKDIPCRIPGRRKLSEELKDLERRLERELSQYCKDTNRIMAYNIS